MILACVGSDDDDDAVVFATKLLLLLLLPRLKSSQISYRLSDADETFNCRAVSAIIGGYYL